MTETQDFSKFFPERKPTKKESLLKRCAELDISPYIDDPSESAPIGALDMRAVASETELEKRINEKSALIHSSKANKIALWALLLSIVSTIFSLVAIFKG